MSNATSNTILLPLIFFWLIVCYENAALFLLLLLSSIIQVIAILHGIDFLDQRFKTITNIMVLKCRCLHKE